MAKRKSRRLTPERQAQIKAQKHAAAVLRRAGLYKPKQPRITNELVRKSGALKRSLKQFQNVVRGEAKAHKVGKRRIVVPVQPGIKTYVRAGRIIERDIRRAGQEALERGRQALDDAAQLIQRARDELAALRENSPSIRSIEGPRYRRLQRKVASNPDSFFKILEVKQRKIALNNQRGAYDKDFTQWDRMLPDDWEDWADEFPELFYYKEK